VALASDGVGVGLGPPPSAVTPRLAALVWERHRIIVNDPHSAHLYTLASWLIRRQVDALGTLDLSAPPVRGDLAGPRSYQRYLDSACELLDHAIDGLTEGAGLVHDNERRPRVFHEAVEGAAGLGVGNLRDESDE